MWETAVEGAAEGFARAVVAPIKEMIYTPIILYFLEKLPYCQPGNLFIPPPR